MVRDFLFCFCFFDSDTKVGVTMFWFETYDTAGTLHIVKYYLLVTIWFSQWTWFVSKARDTLNFLCLDFSVSFGDDKRFPYQVPYMDSITLPYGTFGGINFCLDHFGLLYSVLFGAERIASNIILLAPAKI